MQMYFIFVSMNSGTCFIMGSYVLSSFNILTVYFQTNSLIHLINLRDYFALFVQVC